MHRAGQAPGGSMLPQSCHDLSQRLLVQALAQGIDRYDCFKIRAQILVFIYQLNVRVVDLFLKAKISNPAGENDLPAVLKFIL